MALPVLQSLHVHHLLRRRGEIEVLTLKAQIRMKMEDRDTGVSCYLVSLYCTAYSSAETEICKHVKRVVILSS
jgi:hypothetical protein